MNTTTLVSRSRRRVVLGHHRLRPTVLAAVLVAMGLAACGDDDTSAAPTTAATAASATAATTTMAMDDPTTTSAGDADGAKTTEPATTDVATTTANLATPATDVAVTLSEYAIAMPDEVPAGLVEITATNTGAVDHHVMLLRLHDGLTYDEVLGAYATDPALGATMIDFAGGPNSVAPGATQSAELWLRPGHYFVFCVIPTADGIPHAAMGMIAQLEVVESDDTGSPIDWTAEPVDGTIRLTEYGIDLSAGFDGTGRVLVSNDGAQPHEFAIARIGEGGSYDEFLSTLTADPTTLDPAVLARYTGAGGITPIGPGEHAIVDLDLAPGDYAFVCFQPDAGDGLPHFMHDMVREVTIPS